MSQHLMQELPAVESHAFSDGALAQEHQELKGNLVNFNRARVTTKMWCLRAVSFSGGKFLKDDIYIVPFPRYQCQIKISGCWVYLRLVTMETTLYGERCWVMCKDWLVMSVMWAVTEGVSMHLRHLEGRITQRTKWLHYIVRLTSHPGVCLLLAELHNLFVPQFTQLWKN